MSRVDNGNFKQLLEYPVSYTTSWKNALNCLAMRLQLNLFSTSMSCSC